MTDITYTIAELQQAMREMNYGGFRKDIVKIAEQADKNRIAKEGPGFTEAQIRTMLHAMLKMDNLNHVESRGIYWTLQGFVSDAIKRLREPETVPEPVEGGVYRSPGGILHRRSQGRWQMFGLTAKLTDDELGYPVEKMERVL